MDRDLHVPLNSFEPRQNSSDHNMNHSYRVASQQAYHGPTDRFNRKSNHQPDPTLSIEPVNTNASARFTSNDRQRRHPSRSAFNGLNQRRDGISLHNTNEINGLWTTIVEIQNRVVELGGRGAASDEEIRQISRDIGYLYHQVNHQDSRRWLLWEEMQQHNAELQAKIDELGKQIEYMAKMAAIELPAGTR